MKKIEATQHSIVAAWMKSYLKTQRAVAVEIKHTRGKASIPFSALETHQKEALNAAFTGSVVHKLDDGVYRQLPFDMFGIANSMAFVAVRFPKVITLISISRWCAEEKVSTRKSLTEARARAIAYEVIRCG